MGQIDIKKLNLDELIGVVNIYPWFSGARKELCARMSRMGDAWGDAQFADAALYIADRELLADMLRSASSADMSDSDVEKLLKSYISEEEKIVNEAEPKQRTVHVVGGDYFSQSDYEAVKKTGDNIFTHYAAKAKKEKSDSSADVGEIVAYTETLAEIYLEQGYPEQAKRIYSKLLLAYPEKNTYFAALIAKIENEIINQ
jgi:hypothetical protein